MRMVAQGVRRTAQGACRERPRVADGYPVPKRRVEVEVGDDKVAFRVADLRGDEKKFAESITRLATGDKKARSMAKTLDRQLYGARLCK